MNDQLTVGTAMVMGWLIVVFLALRWYFRPEPTAKHGPGRVWTRPVQALVKETTRCRFEGLDTVHVRTRVTDELICWSCGHIHGGVR